MSAGDAAPDKLSRHMSQEAQSSSTTTAGNTFGHVEAGWVDGRSQSAGRDVQATTTKTNSSYEHSGENGAGKITQNNVHHHYYNDSVSRPLPNEQSRTQIRPRSVRFESRPESTGPPSTSSTFAHSPFAATPGIPREDSLQLDIYNYEESGKAILKLQASLTKKDLEIEQLLHQKELQSQRNELAKVQSELERAQKKILELEEKGVLDEKAHADQSTTYESKLKEQAESNTQATNILLEKIKRLDASAVVDKQALEEANTRRSDSEAKLQQCLAKGERAQNRILRLEEQVRQEQSSREDTETQLLGEIANVCDLFQKYIQQAQKFKILALEKDIAINGMIRDELQTKIDTSRCLENCQQAIADSATHTMNELYHKCVRPEERRQLRVDRALAEAYVHEQEEKLEEIRKQTKSLRVQQKHVCDRLNRLDSKLESLGIEALPTSPPFSTNHLLLPDNPDECRTPSPSPSSVHDTFAHMRSYSYGILRSQSTSKGRKKHNRASSHFPAHSSFVLN